MKTKIASFTLLLLIIGIVSCKKDKVTLDEDDQPTGSTSVSHYHGLGAIKTPRSIYDALPVYQLENSRPVQPLTFIQSHPPVGDQGASETCAAWAFGYAARSIAYKSSHPSSSWSNSVNKFSPAYVYNSLNNGSCSVGVSATDVFHLFKTKGVCTWTKKPFVAGQCSPVPNAVMNSNAASYKIANHSWGTISLPSNAAALTQCVNSIKANLLAGNAVICGFYVDNNYDDLASGQILKNYNHSTVRGGHMNAIVGYNQTKKYFILQNSWGTSWATGGLAYVSYDMLLTGSWDELYYLNKQ